MARKHIYAIAWSPRGPTKVGIADNPAQRVVDLQTGNPYRLRVYFAASVAFDITAADAERQMHERLAEHRMTGEWFSVGPRLVQANICALLDSMNVAWARWKPSPCEIAQRLANLDPDNERRRAKRAAAALEERAYQMREFAGAR